MLIGHDDETWDVAVTVPHAFVEEDRLGLRLVADPGRAPLVWASVRECHRALSFPSALDDPD